MGHVPGLGLHGGLFVESGVGEIDVFRVHFFLAKPQTLAEALEVHDLPLPQEADNIIYVRIVGKTQDVVIGKAGLLLCCNGVRATLTYVSRERATADLPLRGIQPGVASNHGDVMHWFPKFGKNMDGFRADVSRELKGDEDDMTQEQFNQMMTEYERTKNPVPDNTPADWEAPAVQWARDNGLLAGDGSGNLMLHSNMTRAQFLVMLKKYHEKKSEIR